jgi:hypothetical protein
LLAISSTVAMRSCIVLLSMIADAY